MTIHGGHSDLYKHLEYFTESQAVKGISRSDLEQMIHDLRLSVMSRVNARRVVPLIPEQHTRSIRTFLNRLLGLELSRQRIMFDWLKEIIATTEQQHQVQHSNHNITISPKEPIRVLGCQKLAVLVYECADGYLVTGPLLCIWPRLCRAVSQSGGTFKVCMPKGSCTN